MATAPSNQFRQMNLTGGYNLSKTTKFVGYWSQGVGTQTEAYLPAGTGPVKSTWVVPRTNLGGEVVSTTYGLKLTSRPVSSLNLGAAYKYDERQNNSSVDSYTTPFNPQDGTLATTNFPYNLAYSRKLRQLNLDADWAFNQGQAVKLGVEKQDNTRWCNNLPTSYKSGTTVVPVGSCVNASDLSETTSRLEYRNSMVENVTGRIGFASSNRTASTYGPDVPFYNADIYTRFIMTDRKRDKIRTSVSWAPAETVDLTVNFESTQDRFALRRNPSGFFDLGLDSVDSKAFNLDATFVVSENVSVNAFFSIDDISSLLKGSGASSAAAANTALAAVAGGAFWNADINDRVETIGLSFQAANLMGSKLDLTGSYIRSKGTSPYALTTGSYLAYSSGATTGVSNTLVKNAVTGYPETFSTSESLSLTGKYQVSKKSAVKVVLTRETLASADPAYYLGLQMGAANAQVAGSSTAKVNNTLINATSVYPYSTLMPTNEQAPTYSVTAIGVSYIFSF
jgi:MtrB/PioB family decaheme-associated outer membrane protein